MGTSGGTKSKIVDPVIVLDGHGIGSVHSASGGNIKTTISDEPIGQHNGSIRHTSTLEIDPISLEIGVLRDVNSWIASSLQKKYVRRTMSLFHGSGKDAVELESLDTLITEVTLPTLDLTSSGDVYMKVKLLPERVVQKRGSDRKTTAPPVVPLSGNWFKFTLSDVLDGNEVQKVESFTIKQGVKKMHTGEDRFAQVEPTKVEFPNLTITVLETRADKLIKWHEDTVVKATTAARDKTRNGQIDFFSRGKSAAFSLTLSDIGIMSVQKSGTHVKAELYCEAMALDPLAK